MQRPPNVISLRGHQDAEQALDDLLSAPRGRGRYSAALTTALGAGTPVVAAAVRRLNSARPDQLLRLGDLLMRFPVRQKVAQALTRAAGDAKSTSARRLGALMLLASHHIDGQIGDEALYGLPDLAETLADTLVNMAFACSRQVALCTDYAPFFRFLLSQSPDVLYAAVGAMAARGDQEARSALCLLATHPHPDLADAAIEAIALYDSPETTRDLSVLARNLPPDLSRVAERHLRKRLLSGSVSHRRSLESTGSARALLSAIDSAGRRALWVRWTPGGKAKEATLLLVLSDTTGIVAGSATKQVLQAQFPANEQAAPSVWRPIENNAALVTSTFVEVEIDYALKLISDVAGLNWLSGTPMPLEYALLMVSLWSAGTSDDSAFAEVKFATGEESALLVENESELLSHPLLEGWYIESHGVRAVARDVRAIGAPATSLTHDNWRILLPALIRLAHDEFDQELRILYAKRLRLMSDWFRAGGQEGDADTAAAAARTMMQSPPEANLLVLRLLQRGVLMALGDWG